MMQRSRREGSFMAPEADRRQKDKSGKFLPALCKAAGTMIISAAILLMLPLAIPKMLGYEVFSVISPSMEPAIPAGSIIYVEAADGKDLKPGDIIAFKKDGDTVTHRVVENRISDGEFITKGDANVSDDIFPVRYKDLIGRVKRHIPYLGALMMSILSTKGKIRALAFVCSGALFSLLGTVLERKDRRRRTDER